MQEEMLDGLARLGFSEKEAKMFIALLSHAGAGVQDLAQETGLPRATCYDLLHDLVARGYVTQGEGEFGRRFFPHPPEKIVRLLEEERATVEKRLNDAVAIVPMLNVLYSPLGPRPRVRYREGIAGLRQLQREYLHLSGEYIQILGLDAFLKLHDESTTEEYREDLAEAPPKRIRSIIITATPERVPAIPNMETIILPPSVLSLEGEMTVCEDRVAFFSYNEDIIAVEVHSAQIAGVCRGTLELAWQAAKVLSEKL